MNLIEELYALQEAHGYLREEDLRALSKRTKVPLYEIEGVSTFYPHFRRTPPPKLHVTACRDLTCCMKDPEAVEKMRKLCEGLDGVEFHPASCLGRCSGALKVRKAAISSGVGSMSCTLNWLAFGTSIRLSDRQTSSRR